MKPRTNSELPSPRWSSTENLEQAGLSDDGRARLHSLKTGIRRTAHLLEQLLALARYGFEVSTDGQRSEFDRIVKAWWPICFRSLRTGRLTLASPASNPCRFEPNLSPSRYSPET